MSDHESAPDRPLSRPLPSHGRFDYAAIDARPPLHWPGGARLAVYLGFAVEHSPFDASAASELPATTARDWGNRVGVWRCLDLLDELQLPAAAFVNTAVYDHCPEVVDAFAARGDEIVGHGRARAERLSGLEAATERQLIAHCRDRIHEAQGTAPAGWLSPAGAESPITPDLLKEAGFRYTLDWCHDDQPTRLSTRAGPLWSLPGPRQIDDAVQIAARQASAADFAQTIVDQFDEMLQQSQRAPLVMAIGLHPHIVGQPHRLRHLRRALAHIASQRRDRSVWVTTPGAIVEAAEASASRG